MIKRTNQSWNNNSIKEHRFSNKLDVYLHVLRCSQSTPFSNPENSLWMRNLPWERHLKNNWKACEKCFPFPKVFAHNFSTSSQGRQEHLLWHLHLELKLEIVSWDKWCQILNSGLVWSASVKWTKLLVLDHNLRRTL